MSWRDRFILARRAMRPVARDGLGLGGLALVVAGVAEWSSPAAMILAGTMMTGVAVLWARRG